MQGVWGLAAAAHHSNCVSVLTDTELKLPIHSHFVLPCHPWGFSISVKSYSVTALPKAVTAIPLSRDTTQIQLKSVGNIQLASWMPCMTSPSWGQENIEQTSVTCLCSSSVWNSASWVHAWKQLWPGARFREQLAWLLAFTLLWEQQSLSEQQCPPWPSFVRVGPGVFVSSAVHRSSLALYRWTVVVGEGYHVCTISTAARHEREGNDASYYIKPWNKRYAGETCSGALAGRSCQLMEELPNLENKNVLNYTLKLFNSWML